MCLAATGPIFVTHRCIMKWRSGPEARESHRPRAVAMEKGPWLSPIRNPRDVGDHKGHHLGDHDFGSQSALASLFDQPADRLLTVNRLRRPTQPL
jgi:hypothetical protein